MIPGWPYSVIAGLEPGRTSWTAVLDAVRLGPDDETGVTATQAREVTGRLAAAGRWREGDPGILAVFGHRPDAPGSALARAHLCQCRPQRVPGVRLQPRHPFLFVALAVARALTPTPRRRLGLRRGCRCGSFPIRCDRRRHRWWAE